MRRLYQSISEHIESPAPIKKAISTRVTRQFFKKGEIIETAENVHDAIYFIDKGIVRLYTLWEDKEISEDFLGEGGWVGSYKSFMYREKDILSLDAIEDTSVLALSSDDAKYLLDNFPLFERYLRITLETKMFNLMRRANARRFTSAQEKYRIFCETFPDLYHRIPLGMAASYMGIAQETLSRIRKEI